MSVKIFFIYADNCSHCMDTLNCIESAVKKCPEISCEILKFNYNSKTAISIAVTKGIDDLPGFVVGDIVFQGSDYTEKRIVDAIKNYSKRKS